MEHCHGNNVAADQSLVFRYCRKFNYEQFPVNYRKVSGMFRKVCPLSNYCQIVECPAVAESSSACFRIIESRNARCQIVELSNRRMPVVERSYRRKPFVESSSGRIVECLTCCRIVESRNARCRIVKMSTCRMPVVKISYR